MLNSARLVNLAVSIWGKIMTIDNPFKKLMMILISISDGVLQAEEQTERKMYNLAYRHFNRLFAEKKSIEEFSCYISTLLDIYGNCVHAALEETKLLDKTIEGKIQ